MNNVTLRNLTIINLFNLQSLTDMERYKDNYLRKILKKEILVIGKGKDIDKSLIVETDIVHLNILLLKLRSLKYAQHV